MVELSELAQKGLSKALAKGGEFIGLRLVIHGEIPAAYQPELIGVAPGDKTPNDMIVQSGDLSLYLDPTSAAKSEGLKIDVVSTNAGPRFVFDFPPPVWDDPIAERLQKLIDQRINPGLMSHGGYVGLLDVQNGVAEILMGGGCQGCALSAMTMSQGVETIIKTEMPEIHTVIDKTNHTMGANPYYQETRETQSDSKSALQSETNSFSKNDSKYASKNDSKSARRRARRSRK